MKKSTSNEKGAIMLEAMIVYGITMILLFFILAIFCVLFQRWNLHTITNEAAAKIAQTYRFEDADVSSGYVTKDELTSVEWYRNMFGNKSLQNSAKVKVEDYATLRLSKTTFTKNVTDPKVTVKVVRDSLGRRHIEVRITGEYSVPFGEALSYFGFSGTTEYDVTGYAECIDIMDYVNTVDLVDRETSLGQFHSKIIDAVDTVLGLIDHVKERMTADES